MQKVTETALTGIDFVEKFLVLVHPDFSRTHRVVIENVDYATRPRVRGHLTEHVTDTRTRRD